MPKKMEKERAFEHESLQDRESILAYLRALIDGFESGVLTLSDNDREISLEPKGLVNFAVKAQQKRNRVNLNLKISWAGDGTNEESTVPKLRIGHLNGNGSGNGHV